MSEMTALHLAIYNDNQEIIQLLLKNKRTNFFPA